MLHNPAYPDTNKTICLDFDGVIHDDNRGYCDGTVYGNPTDGAIEGVKEIAELGYKIIICSTKARGDRPLIGGFDGKTLIRSWLMKWDISQYISSITAEKPPAFLYVDDKSWPHVGRFDSYKWGCLVLYLRYAWKQPL